MTKKRQCLFLRYCSVDRPNVLSKKRKSSGTRVGVPADSTTPFGSKFGLMRNSSRRVWNYHAGIHVDRKQGITLTRTAGVQAEIPSTYHSNAKDYTPTSGSATSLSSTCSHRRLAQYITQQCMFSVTFGPVHHSAVFVPSDVWSSTSPCSVCSQRRLAQYITQQCRFAATSGPLHYWARHVLSDVWPSTLLSRKYFQASVRPTYLLCFFWLFP